MDRGEASNALVLQRADLDALGCADGRRCFVSRGESDESGALTGNNAAHRQRAAHHLRPSRGSAVWQAAAASCRGGRMSNRSEKFHRLVASSVL